MIGNPQKYQSHKDQVMTAKSGGLKSTFINSKSNQIINDHHHPRTYDDYRYEEK